MRFMQLLKSHNREPAQRYFFIKWTTLDGLGQGCNESMFFFGQWYSLPFNVPSDVTMLEWFMEGKQQQLLFPYSWTRQFRIRSTVGYVMYPCTLKELRSWSTATIGTSNGWMCTYWWQQAPCHQNQLIPFPQPWRALHWSWNWYVFVLVPDMDGPSVAFSMDWGQLKNGLWPVVASSVYMHRYA